MFEKLKKLGRDLFSTKEIGVLLPPFEDEVDK